MESTVRELTPVLVELHVKVPWEAVKAALDVRFRSVGKEAQIKGFRPGKVPPDVIRRLFGKQVREDVRTNLIERGLLDAVAKHTLAPIAEPEVETQELRDGEPYEFTVRLEVRPKVDTVVTEGLTVVRPRHEVTSADVDREIERVRRAHSAVRVPEPMRPAVQGDDLVIDYTVAIDGVEKPDMGATGRTVEVGAGALLTEVEDALVGATPGDERLVNVTIPDDHPREAVRGKSIRFTVQVKELRERVLPAIDDELAKDAGEYQTLLELRLGIRKDLEELAARRTDAELKQRIIDKLVELNPIAVPPALVRQEAERSRDELRRMMEMDELPDAILASIAARAEKQVRAALILGAYGRQHALRATREDIDARLGAMAERSGKHIAKLRAEFSAGEKREALEAAVVEEKLTTALLQLATITEPTAADAQESEPASTAPAAAPAADPSP